MKNIIYIGASWANRSYEDPYGNENTYTNICLQLNINAIDLSIKAKSNTFLLSHMQQHLTSTSISNPKILWVLTEPLKDYLKPNNEYNIPNIKKLFHDPYWNEQRNEQMNIILKKLNSLSLDIALIGADSDIPHDLSNYTNLSVIHNSWQSFLCDIAKIEHTHGFGADIIHTIMHDFKHITPSSSLVSAMYNTLQTWGLLEKEGLFSHVHPNFKATTLFSNKISPNVIRWINDE